jgi:hypothetical protein
MPDEPILRQKAREAILSGRLPTTNPSRTFYGHSAGATCAVCGDPVRRGELDYELEFRASTPPDARPEVGLCYLHQRCFVAWEFERTQVGPPERRPST